MAQGNGTFDNGVLHYLRIEAHLQGLVTGVCNRWVWERV